MELTVIVRHPLNQGGSLFLNAFLARLVQRPKGIKEHLTKTLLLMKLTATFLLVTCLQVHANSHAQKITLSESNVPLAKLFQKIEKQSSYMFWYNNAMLQQAKTVNINVKEATLQQVLDICFKDQPLSYSIIESVVVIKRLDESTGSASQKPVPPAEIKGKVLDENGVPVIGATVTIKGTTRSTATDVNGEFSLGEIEGNITIVITHVNFEAQEIKLNNRTSITVRLTAATRDMESVVVTALGIKREARSVGYATSTVKGEELLKAGTTLNPALALYGKAAGVGINIGSAGPTGGVNVRIRGAAGLESFARTRPLFVVDGVPIYDKSSSMENVTFDPLNSLDYGSGINDINPDDIESMEILKGAKATVLYGSQGLNGVVLITTKSGKKTRGLGITISQQVSVEKPFTFIDFQNEYGSGDHIRDTTSVLLSNGQRVRTMRPSRYSFGPKFDGQPIMRFDSVMVPYKASPDNFLDFFRNGSSSRTNVAIAGGGEFGSARASYSYIDYKDILMGSTQKNHTFSFNGNFNVSPFANFEFITNVYSIKTRNRRPNLEQVVAWGLNRDYDYNMLKDFYLDEFGYRRELDGYALPPSASRLMGVIWEQNNNSDVDNKFHTISSLKSTLNFTREFSLVAQAAIDYTNVDYTTENQIVRLLPQTTGGKYQWRKQNVMVQNYQALLKYDRSFMNKNLRLFTYAGGAYQQVRESNIFAGTGENGLRFPDWYSIANQLGSGGDQSKIRGIVKGSDLIYGVLGSAELSWKNTWILQIDGRNDWNSTLPAGNNSYFYPGISLVYNFTNDFTVPQLKYGKLRMAWADVGGGPSTSLENRYFANNSYSVVTIYEGATISAVVPPSALFLGDIKPFRKREFEIGFNTRWFKQNRLEVDFSFYTNNIYDQIIPLNINPATGYATANINSGNVKNWGYELFVKGAPLVTPKLRWEVSFTAARQMSKVIDLYQGIDEQFITGNNGFKVVATKGKPNGDIQMFDYNRDPAGNPIVNANGLYSLGSELKTFGNVNAKAFGGIYSDFMLKGFNLHIGIDYKFGGTIFSYSNQYLMGNGVIDASLAYRDEAHGGLAYYIDKTSNQKVPWQHNQPAPANAANGIVYHDGLVLAGVKNTGTSTAPKYEKNDILVSAPDYYKTYINDVSTGWPPDRLFKNDYIKLREISISYTLPQKITQMLRLQKLTVNAAARNLGYLHKTLPNVDAEAVLGAQGYIENSFYPAVRTFSAGINVSF
jgi:TonB-linked SusC/RagA family outer membrane protein